MQAVLDEITQKFLSLTGEERRELIRQLQTKLNDAKSGDKKKPNPNIEWLKKHRAEYAGNYVALKDGELIAFGRTIKEADTKAKEKKVKNPLLHYIPAEDEEVWGGW